MGRVARRCALVLVALALTSCTSDYERLTPKQREVMREYVGTSTPSPRYPLSVLFDQRVKLLGYDLNQAEWRHDEPLKIAWYWEVVAPPRPDSKLSTELVDPVSGRVALMLATSAVQEHLPPKHWRAGQFVRDEQTLELPVEWNAPHAMLRRRLDVGDERPHEGSSISISTPRSTGLPTPVPALDLVKTKTAPRLDGSLTDSVWRFAQSTDSPIGATVKMLWDSRFLYVGATVRGADVEDDARAPHVCPAGCVELVFVPEREGSNVFELQVSSSGDVWQSRYERGSGYQADGHVDWASRARTSISAGTAAGVQTAEIAIPWQAFSLDASAFSSPAPGDLWRFNVYAIGSQKPAAWSEAATRDFHVPGRFGILRFVGAPEEMQGSSAPIELPEGRLPAPMRRSVNPEVRDALLERNAAEKNRIDAVRAKNRESQTLESSEGGR